MQWSGCWRRSWRNHLLTRSRANFTTLSISRRPWTCQQHRLEVTWSSFHISRLLIRLFTHELQVEYYVRTLQWTSLSLLFPGFSQFHTVIKHITFTYGAEKKSTTSSRWSYVGHEAAQGVTDGCPLRDWGPKIVGVDGSDGSRRDRRERRE